MSIELNNYEFVFSDSKGVDYKHIPFLFDLNAKFFDKNKQTWGFLANDKNNEPTMLHSSNITKILRNSGASNTDCNKIINLLVNDNSIKSLDIVDAYEYDFNKKMFIFPHDYFSTNLTGHGIEFFEIYNSDNKNINEGRDVYLNILESARNGIGDVNALIISSFSIASLFQRRFKQLNKIFPFLLLFGDAETAKTTTAEYLGNIAKYNPIHTNKELTDAILSQMGSIGCLPMILDEFNKLSENSFNFLKTITTTSGRMRRTTNSGDRRDAPDFLRTIIATANEIPPQVEMDSRFVERMIILEFDEKPKNNSDWVKSQIDFDNCNSSLLNYLIHTTNQIDYEKLFNESIIESSKLIKGNRRKGLVSPIFFGLEILKELGVQFDDSIKNDIVKTILTTSKIGLEDIVNNLYDFCKNGYENYDAWEKAETNSIRNSIRNSTYGLTECKESKGINYFLLPTLQLINFSKKYDYKHISKLPTLKSILKSVDIECFIRNAKLKSIVCATGTRCLWIKAKEIMKRIDINNINNIFDANNLEIGDIELPNKNKLF